MSPTRRPIPMYGLDAALFVLAQLLRTAATGVFIAAIFKPSHRLVYIAIGLACWCASRLVPPT